jgi:hypothetical protein
MKTSRGNGKHSEVSGKSTSRLTHEDLVSVKILLSSLQGNRASPCIEVTLLQETMLTDNGVRAETQETPE